eukprot:CAMPEP_0175084284 /NCGR_PEP_ID=MMETSP0052_2-20121109/27954_1 /TAXON_ID=51329 ORGANISM="Polytomella parva, Strain SAG 63-3" /NCGR_SAMPLE_ID=MMETSP0052_2 /ASSEMBLY_ACC=CAM_ASM_000194 /LENGTH=189 /DNA_ID=CAMNT_0016356031 /DNA_START=266 /DNA_END=835 /DNA_ORIENTATION=+
MGKQKEVPIHRRGTTDEGGGVDDDAGSQTVECGGRDRGGEESGSGDEEGVPNVVHLFGGGQEFLEFRSKGVEVRWRVGKDGDGGGGGGVEARDDALEMVVVVVVVVIVVAVVIVVVIGDGCIVITIAITNITNTTTITGNISNVTEITQHTATRLKAATHHAIHIRGAAPLRRNLKRQGLQIRQEADQL